VFYSINADNRYDICNGEDYKSFNVSKMIVDKGETMSKTKELQELDECDKKVRAEITELLKVEY